MCILVRDSTQILHNSLRCTYVLIKFYVYLGFYDLLQFLERERERERARERERFLVGVLLNGVNLTFLSKYSGPTGSIFISVPLLNFQNF